MRLVVIEDDPSISQSLCEGLERRGYEVTATASGTEGVELSRTADFVLLDLGLPDIDGTEVCRQIRETSDVPIIVLTARGDEIDRVVLLELGADDYLVKPFGFRELVARIGAVARRAGSGGPPRATSEAVEREVVQLGPLSVDLDAHRVRIDDEELDLTPKEYDLLVMLAERPGAVRTREDIIEQVWDAHWFGPTKTLDVHISSLRRKLGHADWISTVRGVGYRLEVPG